MPDFIREQNNIKKKTGKSSSKFYTVFHEYLNAFGCGRITNVREFKIVNYHHSAVNISEIITDQWRTYRKVDGFIFVFRKMCNLYAHRLIKGRTRYSLHGSSVINNLLGLLPRLCGSIAGTYKGEIALVEARSPLHYTSSCELKTLTMVLR